MFTHLGYLKFSTFKKASERQQKRFLNYIFGLTNAKNTLFYLETDNSVLKDMIDTVIVLDYYRSLLNQKDNLKDTDKNQLFFLRKSNPRNHMPVLSIVNNHQEPLPGGLLPETYGFIGLQIWQHYDKVIVQHLQNHYTVVCISIFQFLQNYLEDRTLTHPKLENSVPLKKESDRSRFDAKIGKDKIFFLFKVFKKFKKQLVAYEQKNRDCLVVKLKTSPFPIFFWNCAELYPLEFDFDVLRAKGTISFDLLDSYFDWGFIGRYDEAINKTYFDLQNKYD